MRRSERGSALVELVLIVTLLFGFLFAMVDFTLIQASDNAGTNAAREGARQAIVDYLCADTQYQPGGTTCGPTSDASQRITAKVVSRLGGLVAGAPLVTVTCWDGTQTGVEKKCDPATISPGVDLVEVQVMWKRLATSPYGTVTTHTDNATMTIEGSGQGTHSTACQVTATVNPSSVSITGTSSPGPLSSDVAITVATNGFCQPLYLSYTANSTQGAVSSAMATSGTSYSLTLKATGGYLWDPGTHNLNLSELGTYPLSPTHAPTLTVTASASCTITSAAVSPSVAVLASGSGARALAGSVTVTVTPSSAAACPVMNAVFNTSGGIDETRTMTWSSPSFTLAIAAADFTWTTGAKLFTFTDSAGATLATPASVMLTVGSPCAISLSGTPDPATFDHASPPPAGVLLKAAPATGANCTGLTVTYQYGPGNSRSVTTAMTPSGSSYEYTIPSGTNWHAGTWPIVFTIGSTSIPTSPSVVQVVAT